MAEITRSDRLEIIRNHYNAPILFYHGNKSSDLTRLLLSNCSGFLAIDDVFHSAKKAIIRDIINFDFWVNEV